MSATINSDVGEGIGLHSFGNDEGLMKVIDIANVACGFHASDPQIMDRTVALAAENNVKVGAHPGLPDLAGFGRRAMVLTPDEVENLVTYQIGAVTAFLTKHGVSLNHIKAHGALAGMAVRDPEIMKGIARAAKRFEVSVFGFANTPHQTVCEDMGVEFVGELYVDLNYTPSGELIIERAPKPADPQEAHDRVVQALTSGTVRAIDGTSFEIPFDSICVHSDPGNAVDVAAAVRRAIQEN